MNRLRKTIRTFRSNNYSSWTVFFLLVYLIVLLKIFTIDYLTSSLFFASYSMVVCVYIISRFALSYLYSPETDIDTPDDYEPTIAFGVPSKNEEANIRETILRIAASDYPVDKFEIIAVNDGSDDNTLEEMLAAQEIAERRGVRVRVIDWAENRGKRHGMAECVRSSDSEVIVFIDSDSFVEKDTARKLSRYFYDKKIAAVTGHTYVTNADENILTKMQSVRYFVAFKANKSAEAIFGAVTCCSGCCSAYRRKHVLEVLEPWFNQKFLGVTCTYGDDRSLTNFLLHKGYQTVFAPDAIAHTIVPADLRTFMRQQLRWKKSWVKESFKAASFIWKKNPIMSLSFYASLILPFLTPLVVIRALIWYPFFAGRFPLHYCLGLVMVAALFGVYYYIFMKDRKWVYGVLFSSFYSLILIWQLPMAIVGLRDVRWGTR